MKTKPLEFVARDKTFQGEGKYCGQRVFMARLKDCNYNCPWCDTMKLYKNKELIDVNIITDEFKASMCNTLMITGGEPTLYNKSIVNWLSDVLIPQRCISRCIFETNGSYLKELHELMISNNVYKYINVAYACSPKVETDAGKEVVENLKKLIKSDLGFADRLTVKFVYGVSDDEYLKNACDELVWSGIDPANIFMMPLGAKATELNNSMKKMLRFLKNIDYDVSISSRLHILHNFK